ncbi:MAG: hypothetical protein FJW63_03080 [Actinobacteria bacterium]|nr:hypothetical protein [Actinomycetota bacterium]
MFKRNFCNRRISILKKEVGIHSLLINSYRNNFDHSKNDDRSILVKIIISEDKETIDKIISASNSQTNVTPAILRATDALQRKIETFFTKQDYFYERRKNYVDTQPHFLIFCVNYLDTYNMAIILIIVDKICKFY